MEEKKCRQPNGPDPGPIPLIAQESEAQIPFPLCACNGAACWPSSLPSSQVRTYSFPRVVLIRFLPQIFESDPLPSIREDALAMSSNKPHGTNPQISIEVQPNMQQPPPPTPPLEAGHRGALQHLTLRSNRATIHRLHSTVAVVGRVGMVSKDLHTSNERRH